ncbi:MAG: rhamnogalacturonan acetylesterase [Opitutaceae bacterium]|nr:rhamnogalacturonan acetylesterase [Verrucomicrobiales bacterium]
MNLRLACLTVSLLICLTTDFTAHSATPRTSFKFDFGSGPVAAGLTRVSADTVYSTDHGFGFEPGAKIIAVGHGGKDPMHRGFCTSEQPFLFSVAVPEGNYRVTVTLGAAAEESSATIKAESRRLMLEQIQVAHGKSTTRAFTVNVRTAALPDGGSVKLKDREKGYLHWDDKLTLEFNGVRPGLCALEIERVDNAVTAFLLGDSTVTDQPREPYNSWGQMLPRFLKPDVAVANHAESGESLKSSLGARRLDKVLGSIKSGDFVLIQFGHNDQKERGEGVGAFTTYKASLKQFVSEARKRGATPVVITPVARRNFNAAGELVNNLGDYPEAVRQVAKEENVALIDLHAMSRLFYVALETQSKDVSKKAFAPGDNTHHNNYGSYELAKCIVEGIKVAKLPLAKFIVDDVASFDPAHPDPIETFGVPASPNAPTVKPDGNYTRSRHGNSRNPIQPPF